MAESQLYSTINDWLSANPDLIAISIAAIAFIESFAIVGVIVPGVMMLAAASFVAGTGLLALPLALGAAWFGAVLGDGVSFLIGQRFHGAIRGLRPFADHPEWIDNAEAVFRRYGWLSVVIGRFVGPIRPIIPMVAGALDMNASIFFGVNAVSAIAWAPVYVLPGYLLGANIDNEFDSQTLLFAVLALGVAVVVTAGARQMLKNRASRNN